MLFGPRILRTYNFLALVEFGDNRGLLALLVQNSKPIPGNWSLHSTALPQFDLFARSPQDPEEPQFPGVAEVSLDRESQSNLNFRVGHPAWVSTESDIKRLHLFRDSVEKYFDKET